MRSYRQISIAITEKHLTHISSPFNRHDDKSVDAQLEVAFAWQSGHRPQQRAISYGIDAAFPDSLQPALLRVYKWASNEWHRFLDRTRSKKLPDDDTQSTEVTTVTRKRPRLANKAKGIARKAREPPLIETEDCADTAISVTEVGTTDGWQMRLGVPSFGSHYEILPSPDGTPGTQASRPTRSLQDGPTTVGESGFGVLSFQGRAGRDATDCLHYDSRFCILICKEHGYALESWKTHLSKYHAFNRDELKHAAGKLQGLEIMKPEDAPLPPANEPPIPFLRSSRAGFQCKGLPEDSCNFISSSRAKTAEHCNKAHGWRSCPEERTSWNEVKIQSFSTTPGRQRWFVVRD